MSSDPFDRGDLPVDPEAFENEDADLPVEHDATGIDLATSIAHQTIASAPTAGAAARVHLPPSRGVRPAWQRRRRPEGVQFSGSGPDERDPQPVGAALKRVMHQRGWTREVNVRTLLARWSDLVGATNAAHSTPEAYTDGVLTIRTESTTWATSLRALAPNLVAQLNSELGDGTVKRIQVLGPQAPSWKHGRRSVPGRGPRDTYG